MRVDIDTPADRSEGLRVISEIPDFALCHLEGRNGIGKTLASRILELVTGGQPFAASPNAWRTLKTQLGSTTIRVSELPGGSRLEFRLTPATWPDHPVKGLTTELGQARVNGRAGTWEAARALLVVHRISGDETLLQTLARDLEERGVRADQARSRLEPVAHEWESRLDALAQLTRGLSRTGLQQRADAAAHARQQLDDAITTATAQRASSEAARDARDHIIRLIERRRTIRTDLEHFRRAASDLATAEHTLDRAQSALLERAAAFDMSAAVKKDIRHWERLRGLRRTALQRARIEQEYYERLLGFDETPSAKALSRRRDGEQRRRQTLADERAELDEIGPLLTLTDQLERPLETSPQLHDRIVANLDTPATAEQLLTGIKDRRSELEGEPKPGRIDELDQQLRQAEQTIKNSNALAYCLRVTEQKQKLSTEAEAELSKLFEQSAKGDKDAYEAARTSVEDARQTQLTAAIEKRDWAKRLAELIGFVPAPTPETKTAEPNDTAVEEESDDEGLTGLDRVYDKVDEKLVEDSAARLDRETAALLQRLVVDEATRPTMQRLARLAGGETEAEPNTLDALATSFTAWLDGVEESRSAAEESEHQARADLRAHSSSLSEIRHALRDASRSLRSQDDTFASWAEVCAPIFTAADTPSREELDLDLGGPVGPGELRAADAVETIHALVSAMSAAVLQVPNDFAALSLYLMRQAAEISPRSAASLGNVSSSAVRSSDLFSGPTSEALRSWLQSELAALLTAPEVLDELFDGSASVQVNLTDLTVLWRARDGSLRKRPVEAFSSGEQVFAYTRANLSRLRDQRRTGQASMIFLDEFGAFVARDRLGQLMSYVEHGALGAVADQVIVMLPLAQDLDWIVERGERNSGNLPARDVIMADEVRRRGYFAVPFTSGRASVA